MERMELIPPEYKNLRKMVAWSACGRDLVANRTKVATYVYVPLHLSSQISLTPED
jgi:hypothetical protein